MQNQPGGNAATRERDGFPRRRFPSLQREERLLLVYALETRCVIATRLRGAPLYATTPNDRGAPLSRALHRFFLSIRMEEEREREREIEKKEKVARGSVLERKRHYSAIQVEQRMCRRPVPARRSQGVEGD